MGTDPRVCWQSLPWLSVNSNYDGDVNGRDSAPPIAAFSSDHLYANRFGSGVGGDATVAAPGRFLQWSSEINPPPPNYPTTNSPPAERRFLIFDQSGDGTSLLFSSVGPRPPVVWDLKDHRSPQKPKLVLDKYEGGMGSLGGVPGTGNCYYYAPLNLSAGGTAEVSDGGGGCDEMREDTDEIDALLYSDSEFEEESSGREEEEEDEASTGDPLPQGPTSVSAEQVASNSVVPTKRRRLVTDEEALMDTASSAARRASDCVGDKAGCGDHDAQSSCVAGARELGEQEPPRAGAGKGLKRARIQETLCVLRKIVPGGKGKDDAAVLDEAIRYLRSLKLKAKALGNKLK